MAGKRLAGAALVALALITGCPGGVERPSAGDFIEVNGRRIFYNLMRPDGGKAGGAPVVILMSGLYDRLVVWNKVQPRVAEFATVLSYDRGGVGLSDKGENPRTAPVIADELEGLLRALELDPPYILVAHSFAGLFARAFAAIHPADIAGIVLLDTTHEDRWDRQARRLDPRSIQAIEFAEIIAENVMAGYGSAGEWQNRNNTAEFIRVNRKLPEVPMLLLSQGRPEFSYLSDAEANVALLIESEMNDDQIALVPRGIWEEVPGAGHIIHQDKPLVVVEAIQRVIAGW